MSSPYDDPVNILDSELRTVTAERDRLRADVAAMRKDAERYRWLRDNGTSEWGICVWGDDDQEWAQDIRAADVVDRAIDAAMELHNAGITGGTPSGS